MQSLSTLTHKRGAQALPALRDFIGAEARLQNATQVRFNHVHDSCECSSIHLDRVDLATKTRVPL
jgi:hypothetical protein